MKTIISKATLKKSVGVKIVDEARCAWLERWVEQLIRENSYPPQLLSNDFYNLLTHYFDNKKAIEILEKLRADYMKAFSIEKEQDDNLLWLNDAIKNDAVRMPEIPKGYLN